MGLVSLLRSRLGRFGRSKGVDEYVLAQLDLERIEQVVFFKRDEVTTDLICCEVGIDGSTWLFHEEAKGWDSLLNHLAKLPGWRTDWFSGVSKPAFEECRTVAFRR